MEVLKEEYLSIHNKQVNHPRWTYNWFRGFQHRNTSSRSLEQRLSCCIHAQGRYVWRSEWNCHLTGVVTTHKKRSCRVIWLVFVLAHARSYIFLWHENVSGSFETPSCFRYTYTRFIKLSLRKVVTRMLHRITLVYVICRQIWTKRQVNIWTSVRTQ